MEFDTDERFLIFLALESHLELINAEIERQRALYKPEIAEYFTMNYRKAAADCQAIMDKITRNRGYAPLDNH